LTVAIDPPATATRLVIGALLSGSVSLLVIDPEDETDEVRKLSQWSKEEIALFSCAKRLTYIGDHAGASALVRKQMELAETGSFDQPELQTRDTDFGSFVGLEERRRTPDGHELRMFRGLERRVYGAVRDGLLIRDSVPSNLLRGGALLEGTNESAFRLETSSEGDSALVRSVAWDGSMFEIRIS
jgi:hypothetical protein